jgi:thiaminase (transcriptional activator TenA)
MLRVLAFALAALSAAGADASFTDRVWREIAPVYNKTLAHPYLKGLADGTLPRAKFDFYLQQDSHYLRAFSQALNVIASKAPREDWAITLTKHSIEALEVERSLHKSLLGTKQMDAQVAPSNYAYTTHLLAIAHRGSFAEGLAAMLPCYWIYWEVGKELKRVGSKNKDYQRWIDQYADPQYGKTVQQVLDMMNAEASRITEAERAAAARHFGTSARYEYLFWDAAWREERWLP